MLRHFLKDTTIVAGCDEAGRGCLAGPVYAAAVVLKKDFRSEKLNDSKKLTASVREKLRIQIESEALAWSVGIVNEKEIDRINILNASFLAMHRALDELKRSPELIIVDGNRFKPYKELPHKCLVKGDANYYSIAAASILAKTYRDHFMEKIHKKFPIYNWRKNKGYGTKEHREAIQHNGVSKYHRKSFKLYPEQLILEL